MRFAKNFKKLNVKICLTRPSWGDENKDGFELTINDEASLLEVAEIYIPVKAFADMMSARTCGEICECELNTDNRIGKKHENKTVFIHLKKRKIGEDIKNLNKEIDKWEAEENKNANPGEEWIVDRDRTWNGHRWSNHDNTYRVIARRWR